MEDADCVRLSPLPITLICSELVHASYKATRYFIDVLRSIARIEFHLKHF